MAEVLVVGSVVSDVVFEVDAFPDKAEKYRARSARIVGGGCAGNAAVAIARLGGTAILVARLGDDVAGALALQGLIKEGVDCAHVSQSAGGQSALSSVFVAPDGERQIMAFRGAGLADAPDLEGLRPAAVLADTRWPVATISAFDLAKGMKIPAVLDGEAPISAEMIEAASHVAFSAQGLRDFSGETQLSAALGKVAADFPLKWLAVTDGENGTLAAYDATNTTAYPAFAVDVVDTLGAGDVWHGAFALRLAEGATEVEAIRFASAAAALKCMRSGGREGAPTRAEVECFLEGKMG